jgi:CDP-diacylglycerol---glycerol-3-phosphate 3-phosphatidyltransferase
VSAPVVAASDRTMAGYKARVKALANGALEPVVAGMAGIGLRPNHLTVLGFTLSLGAGYAFALGRFRTGAVIATVSGLFDILDGQLARRTNTITRFGAFFDSTLDRMADAALLLGFAGFYMIGLLDMAENPQRVLANLQRGLEPITWAVLAVLAMLAVVGSFMVSYTRARAEGLGLDCKVGWFERPERIVLIILMGLAGVGPVIPAGLLILTGLSFATAFQRMAHVWKITRDAGSDSTHTEA